jgi:hypothetical protein
MDPLATFGNFHVLLLHLPIGLVAAVAALEALTLRSDAAEAARTRGGQRVLMWLLGVSAAVTAGAGYVLSLHGYEGSTVSLHMWLGIGVAVLALATAAVHERAWRAARRGAPSGGLLAAFRMGLLGTIALMVPAGHLGGTLTHGEDFLFAPPRTGVEQEPSAPSVPSFAAGSSEFGARVLPVFEANCWGCHGDARQKGGLALHTSERIRAGGKHGPVLVAGDPGASEIVRRLRLPMDHKEHMPPKDKRQPTADDRRGMDRCRRCIQHRARHEVRGGFGVGSGRCILWSPG